MNLIYAFNKENTLKHIDEVPNGIKCNCFCPACRSPLIARNHGKIKENHFAHQGDKNCIHGYQTQLHLLTKEIFKDIKEIQLPDINYEIEPMLEVTFKENNKFVIESLKLENKISNVVPDILVRSINGFELIIEIKVTHGIDEIKFKKLKMLNMNCIEINLEDFALESIDQLKKVLINETNRWHWVSTQNKELIESKLLSATETIDVINIAGKKITKFCPALISEIGIKGQTCANLMSDCKNCPFNLGISSFENQIQCGGKLKIVKAEDVYKISSSKKINGQVTKAIYNDNSEVYLSYFTILEPKTINELWNGEPILVKNLITKIVFFIKKSPFETIESNRCVYGDMYKDGVLIEKNKEIFYYQDSQWVLIPKGK